MRKRKKNSKFYVDKVRKIIYSNKFKERNRKSHNDFIRRRKLPFPQLILFMLNVVRQSLQKELTEFYLNFSAEKNITNSAFCQSRMKLSHTAFIELNDAIIEEFYTDNVFQLWKGFRLSAVDGSKMQLPFSSEIVEKFGRAKNNHTTIIPMAQTSFCFDVLNSMIVNSEIDKNEMYEVHLALRHLQKCRFKKDLFVYDRGFSAIWFMLCHVLKKKNFVIRMNKNSIEEVKRFFNSEDYSKIIEIKGLSKKSEKQANKLGLEFKPFKIRLVKVILNDGEIEVLATSLIDENKYPSNEFKWLYGKRWGIETNYDHLKNHLMIEDFTGLSALSILQDFFANVFMANMQQILINEAQEELREQKKDTEYEYKINRNLSFGFMKDRFVKILFEKEADKSIRDLKKLFKINPTPIREGRKFPRVYHVSRKKFYMSRMTFSKTRYFSGEIQKTSFLSMLKNRPLSRQPL